VTFASAVSGPMFSLFLMGGISRLANWKVAQQTVSEMSMGWVGLGWVDPWVGLGRVRSRLDFSVFVGLGAVQQNY